MQDTHTIDAQWQRIGQPKFLVWTKTSRNAKGQSVPVGSECYNCYDIRRLYVTRELSAKDLATSWTDKPSEHKKFMDRRQAKLAGERTYAESDEILDPRKAKTEEEIKQFGRKYQQGTWQDIWVFAEERGMTEYDESKDGDLQLLIDALANRYPDYEIKEDKSTGQWGVVIIDGIRGGLTSPARLGTAKYPARYGEIHGSVRRTCFFKLH